MLSKIVADDIHFSHYFSNKKILGISCEPSARQTVHTKCQALFSLKIKHAYFKVSPGEVDISVLRVSYMHCTIRERHLLG